MTGSILYPSKYGATKKYDSGFQRRWAFHASKQSRQEFLKNTNDLIGQCGLTMQSWKDTEVLEIGYLFNRTYWHKGYATEAAKACKKYAFEILKASEVCSIIRDTNIASQNVAVRNGMIIKDSWIKHYRGIDMPHYRYVVYNQSIPVFSHQHKINEEIFK